MTEIPEIPDATNASLSSQQRQSQTQSLAGVMSRLVALTEAERAIFDGEIDDLSERVDSVPDTGIDPATEVWAENGDAPGGAESVMTLHARSAEGSVVLGTLTEIVLTRPSPAFLFVFTGPRTVVAKVTHNPFQSTVVPRNDLDPFRNLPVLASVVTILPPASDRTSSVIEALLVWQSASATPFKTPKFDVAKSKLKPSKPRSVILEGGNCRLYASGLPANFPQSGRRLPDWLESKAASETPSWVLPLVAFFVVVGVGLAGYGAYKLMKSRRTRALPRKFQ
jgi:hypothetical protein